MTTTAKLCIAAGVILALAGCDRTRQRAETETAPMEEEARATGAEAEQEAQAGMEEEMREMEPGEPAAETMGVASIVDTAAAAGRFETLTQALQTAGLAETLQGEGPYTVFAPNDEAFAELPQGTLEDLMKEENRERLRSVLMYHVASGDMRASDVTQQQSIGTLQGEPLAIERMGNEVRVDGATVVQPDIQATNGVIHEIDTVLMPPE